MKPTLQSAGQTDVKRNGDPTASVPKAYWNIEPKGLLAALSSAPTGLAQAEAESRLKQVGPNALEQRRQATALRLFLNQFRSPLVLILIFAAIVSAVVGEWVDASIVLAVVLGSTILGFTQEYMAGNAVEKLRSQVTIKSNVLRDREPRALPSEQIVPGDVVNLSAGSLIPADGILLDAQDFFVSQAVLTGETFPVEKTAGAVAEDASLAERTNCVFMGTSVRSGTAQVLIVQTGKGTVFGQIAEHLNLRPQETEFERGIQRFGYLLTRVMLVMVIIVLAVNILLKKPAIELAVVCTGACCWAGAGTAASHHQRDALAWSTADGKARGHCPAAQLDRKLRQHGRALHR